MAGSRSPNYPQLSVLEALDKLRDLRRNVGDRRERSPRELAAAMGYSDLNGAAQQALSALRKYGFLSGGQGALSVSQQALDVLLLPAGSPERERALRQSVLGVPVFREILAAQRAGDEATLPHRLVRQGFSDKAAERLLEIHRANLEHLATEGVALSAIDPPPASAPAEAARTVEPEGEEERFSPGRGEPTSPPPASTLELELTCGSTRVKISAQSPEAIDPEVLRLLQQLLALAGSPRRSKLP